MGFENSIACVNDSDCTTCSLGLGTRVCSYWVLRQVCKISSSKMNLTSLVGTLLCFCQGLVD